MSFDDGLDVVLKSRLAREFLVRLYLLGRMYTRRLLGHDPAKKRHRIIVELEQHGSDKTVQG